MASKKPRGVVSVWFSVTACASIANYERVYSFEWERTSRMYIYVDVALRMKCDKVFYKYRLECDIVLFCFFVSACIACFNCTFCCPFGGRGVTLVACRGGAKHFVRVLCRWGCFRCLCRFCSVIFSELLEPTRHMVRASFYTRLDPRAELSVFVLVGWLKARNGN